MPKFRVPQWIEVLGLYNAEVSRGLVHTPEWDERMKVLQALFDKNIAEEAQAAAEDFTRQRRGEIGLSDPFLLPGSVSEADG